MCFIAAMGVCFAFFLHNKERLSDFIFGWLKERRSPAFPQWCAETFWPRLVSSTHSSPRFARLSVRPLRFPFLLGAIALTAMLSGNG